MSDENTRSETAILQTLESKMQHAYKVEGVGSEEVWDRLVKAIRRQQLQHIPGCASIVEIGTNEDAEPARIYGLAKTLLWKALGTAMVREEQAERERLRAGKEERA